MTFSIINVHFIAYEVILNPFKKNGFESLFCNIQSPFFLVKKPFSHVKKKLVSCLPQKEKKTKKKKYFLTIF